MTELYDTVSPKVRGIIDREGVPPMDTSPFDMSDEALADWLADVIGRVRGAELTSDERENLEEIVAAERDGIESWLLTCWADVAARGRA